MVSTNLTFPKELKHAREYSKSASNSTRTTKKVQSSHQNQKTPRKREPRTPTIYLSLLSGVHLWLHNKFLHL